jgi:hypothetical protein
MKRILVIILILLIAITIFGCKSNWETTTVDTAGNVGEYSSIAIDGNGIAHIAYLENLGEELLGDSAVPYGNLKYATNADGTWEVITLDIYAGMTPRIIVDKNNNVHIVHSKLGVSSPENLTDLRYTTNASGTWETVSINAKVVKGSDASIAVDTNLKIHICAYNNEGAGTTSKGAKGGLRYLTNTSGEWTWVDLDNNPSAGNDTDIVVDSNDFVHISYLDKKEGLKYATNLSGDWNFEIVDNTPHVGWNTSIATDSNNKAHISYSDPADFLKPPGNGYLKYATNQSENWTTEILDREGAGLFTGLSIDNDDIIHIAYYVYKEGLFTGRLMYISGNLNQWVKETIDDMEFVGLYCAIDTDIFNEPYFSYYDYLNQDLKFAEP